MSELRSSSRQTPPLRLAVCICCLLALAGNLLEARSPDDPAGAAGQPGGDVFYRVQWIRVEMPREIAAGGAVRVLVTLRNSSQSIWPDPQMADPVKLSAAGAVRLSYRWWEGERDVLVADYTTRSDLPWPLRPAETITLPLSVQAPVQPGRYRLQLDLVQELLTWFESQGASRLIMPVLVRPAH